MKKYSSDLVKLAQELKGYKKIKWKFNPRPYTDEEARVLLKEVISVSTSDWHYNKHHKGYVDALNKIEDQLEDAKRKDANGNYSYYGELKRRQTWNHAGAVLHDVYWDNLGGDGNQRKGKDILNAIKDQWGSYSNWKKDFIATCMSAKLSGWGVLVYDSLYSKSLMNVLVDEHHYGAIWGGIPIISCDVFEHAYYHKDGPDREGYVKNFLNNLDWDRVNLRYLGIFGNPPVVD